MKRKTKEELSDVFGMAVAIIAIIIANILFLLVFERMQSV